MTHPIDHATADFNAAFNLLGPPPTTDCLGCAGEGEFDCETCEGLGEVNGRTCDECTGIGKEECEDCDGSGQVQVTV